MTDSDSEDGHSSVQLNGSLNEFSSSGYQSAATVPLKSTAGESDRDQDSTVCSECGSVIRNAANVVVHMRRHLAYKPYACSRCSYTGYDEDDVKRHASRTHTTGAEPTVKFRPDKANEQRILEMTGCNRMIEASIGVKDRLSRTATPDAAEPTTVDRALLEMLPRICCLCQSTVGGDLVSVMQHARCHANCVGFKCSWCSEAVDSYSNLVQHTKQAHSNATDVEQRLADVRRQLRQCFVRLVDMAFPQTTITCGMCTRGVIVGWETVSGHVNLHAGHTPFTCSICDTSFGDMSSAQEHFSATHPDSFPVLACCFQSTNRDVADLWDLIFPALSMRSVFSSGDVRHNSSDTPMLFNLDGVKAAAAELYRSTINGTSANVGESSASYGRLNVDCQLCRSQISRNMSCLIAHAKVHLAYKPLKCEYCSFRHFAMSKIRRHNARVHPGENVKVSYHPVSDIGRQVKEMKLKCFGALASSTVWNNEDLDNADDDDCSDLTTQNQAAAISPASSDEYRNQSPVEANIASKLFEQLVRDRNIYTGPTSTSSQLLAPSRVAAGVRDALASPSDRSQGTNGFDSYDLTGLGKKACALCNIYLANNPSSFENHACKHMDYKPYYCRYCAYQSYIRGKVTRHIQQVHSGQPIKIDHKPLSGIKEKIQQMKLACFPFLANDQGELDSTNLSNSVPANVSPTACSIFPTVSPVAESVQCRICEARMMAMEAVMDEHMQVHIPAKFYHCPVCTYQTEHLIRAKQHVHSAHPTSQHTRILCCPPDGLAGLQSLRVRCFGLDIWTRVTGKPINSNKLSDSPQPKGDDDGDDAPLPVSTGDYDDEDDDDDDDEQLGDIEDDAMDMSGTSTTTLPSAGRVQCAICKALVPAQPATVASHVRNHLEDFKPYHCPYCQWKSAVESDVKQHVVIAHKGVPAKVLFNPERQELAKMQDRCFPNLRLSASNPSLSSPTKIEGLGMNPSGGTTLKKLVCQLCKNTIADNPKSVGIHVKNHLNYKPYRCSFCKYMSCEQSKARRHVEHVHNVSGDAVEIHAEEGIKERIAEMKARCFPTLVGDVDNTDDVGVSMVVSDVSKHKCLMCQESVLPVAVDAHVRTHLGKAFRCDYCTSRFWTEEKVRQHIANVHPGQSARFLNQTSDLDIQFHSIKAKCFPALADESLLDANENSDQQLEDDNSITGDSSMPSSNYPMASNGRPSLQHRGSLAEGKLACSVCNNWVSVNPNSLEVHAKTHLNFKQHQCGYCQYRSCIAGKVKRHLDNVHRGQDVSMLSFTALSVGLKQIIADTRSLCFPQIEGEYVPQSPTTINRQIEALKRRLVDELKVLETSTDLDTTERAAAVATCTAATSSVGPAAFTKLESAALATPNVTPVMAASTPQWQNSFVNGHDSVGDALDADMGRAESETASCAGDSAMGKLQCQRCLSYVADNPSSLGLHVRNHLDYKPFSCNLCEYKSCIQAKVKRHLRNVHKCPTDEMTYSPEPDIRLKVMDMKMRCFPKIVEAGESTGGQSTSFNSTINSMQDTMKFAFTEYMSRLVNGDAQNVKSEPIVSDETNNNQHKPSSSGGKSLDSILGAKFKAGLLNSTGVAITGSSAVAKLAEGKSMKVERVVECQLCAEGVTADNRLLHATKHANESRWMCSDCGFASLLEQNVAKHALASHADSATQPVRFPVQGALSAEEEQRFDDECFADVGEDEDDDEEDKDDDENAMELDPEDDEGSGSESETYSNSVEAQETLGRRANLLEGPRYICQLCGQAVSMYASSLYVHVKNHMNYKPYCCAHCDYRSPVKSKVRRHIQNAHRKLATTINYFPTPGIEHEVHRMKKQCFPDVTSFATLTNDKIPCLLCKTDVADTLLSKTVHAKNHLDSKPFHCGYCSYRSCLKGETRRHVTRQHSGKSVKILFRQEEVVKKDAVDQMIGKCFDPPPGGISEASGLALMQSLSQAQQDDNKLEDGQQRVKLGPAYRAWYCPYCPFSDTSKYHIKEHCISDHPGQSVSVREWRFGGGQSSTPATEAASCA